MGHLELAVHTVDRLDRVDQVLEPLAQRLAPLPVCTVLFCRQPLLLRLPLQFHPRLGQLPLHLQTCRLRRAAASQARAPPPRNSRSTVAALPLSPTSVRRPSSDGNRLKGGAERAGQHDGHAWSSRRARCSRLSCISRRLASSSCRLRSSSTYSLRSLPRPALSLVQASPTQRTSCSFFPWPLGVGFRAPPRIPR